MPWEFFIDVGGTFTDVVAEAPDGRLITHKLLSTGAVRGAGALSPDGRCIVDPTRDEPPDFWKEYQLRPLGAQGSITALPHYRIAKSSAGELQLSEPLAPAAGRDSGSISYELRSNEEAPVVAIRRLIGLRRDEPIGPVLVRLGTTRATNALLERKGARVAFVTTAGFADVLKIGYQDRPDLFKLHIQKRDELYECVIEIDERLAADGSVLRPPDPERVRGQLAKTRGRGIQAVAICFLHAHVNPVHEEHVAEIAESLGFEQVSVSSRLSRLERIVPRGDTTVLDAYLSGVIRSYVRSLRESMPQARIQLMTSAGGLIDAASATGKDTILSGPAGGVIGCAHVSRAAGFGRAIGFDMGGTSTDVSRIEPPPMPFEYQQETVKAGVRVQTPVLAIETVAAGGGSICAFDGQKLTVGPQSAGADPGPACYGRGGPLTVTDVNLLLGRVALEHFPFRLDTEAAKRRADEVREQVRTATGSQLSRMALAQGFLAIANANMAAAIRKVSIAKGYDAADYVLTTFGGAGAQHACAIARELGIGRILCNEYAGVLSALGIGVADLKRIEQRSVRMPLTEESLGQLRAIADELRASLEVQLRMDGAGAEALRKPSCVVEMCYAGQSTLLPVAVGTPAAMREAFEAQHQQLYGYRHADRPIELRVIRVELRSEPPTSVSADVRPCEPPTSVGADAPVLERRNIAINGSPLVRESFLAPAHPLGAHCATSGKSTQMIVEGELRSVPLYLRSELHVGRRINGPAIVAEATSTIIIDPGWSGEVLPTGDLVLCDAACRSVAPIDHRDPTLRCAKDGPPDPIALELFNNQFAAIAEQMGTTLRRTALSTNVKERLDFSCAVFTAAGDLVVNAPHIPVHLGGMSDCVKCLIEDVGTFAPGDVYVTNDPYRGGSHLNDVTVITPVHEGDGASDASAISRKVVQEMGGMGKLRLPVQHRNSTGKPRLPMAPEKLDDLTGAGESQTCRGKRILFFVASRAHHAEIGGKRPGSMPPDSTCLADEGVLIRAFACVKDGVFQADKLRKRLTCQPIDNRQSTIDNLHPSRSPDENLADIAAQIAANQRGVQDLQAMVARHGLDTVQAYMGHIQAAAEQKARAAIRKLPSGTYEFTDYLDDGSPIRLKVTIDGDNARFDFTGTGPVLAGNLNANCSIVTSAVLYCLRCLIDEDIPLNGGVLAPVEIILPECFLNPPRYDDPRKCPAVAGGNVETSQRVVDTIFGALRAAAASQGTMNNLLIGNERFGYYETICGGAGAGPTFDGADAVHTNMTNTRLTDPEVLESRYPMRLIRFQIRADSGGAGKHRGGNGVIREIEFLEPLEVSIISQRRSRAPYGSLGGKPGAPGRNVLVRRSDEATERPAAAGKLRDEGEADGANVTTSKHPAAADLRQNVKTNELPGIVSFSADAGDRLIIETPGGGGWGAGDLSNASA